MSVNLSPGLLADLRHQAESRLVLRGTLDQPGQTPADPDWVFQYRHVPFRWGSGSPEDLLLIEGGLADLQRVLLEFVWNQPLQARWRCTDESTGQAFLIRAPNPVQPTAISRICLGQVL